MILIAGVGIPAVQDIPLVHDALVGMGVAGAIISVLLTVIGLLATGNVFQYRHSNKVYGYRLQERDTLKDALNDSKQTLAQVLAGMHERNEITEELTRVIEAHTAAFAALRDKVEVHYTVIKRDSERSEQVITAISESMRTMTIGVGDVKATVMVATAEVKASLATLTASHHAQQANNHNTGH